MLTRRQFRDARSQRLRGERGVLLAVLHQAAFDLHFGNDELRADARRYFESELYTQHLGLLGLPTDWTPTN